MRDPDDVPKPRDNPNPLPPDKDPRFRPNPNPEASLVADLQETVDEIRQLNTDFGVRPYRVFSVVERWTGGERGRGEVLVDAVTEFLPTPLVTNYSRLESVTKAAGSVDRGDVRITEISASYTEDDIMELFHVQPLPKDRNGFIEIVHDRRDGEAKRRRFVVKGIPFHEADKFQWVCSLLAQDQPRTRAGAPRDVRTHAVR